ncbi:serine hydrolase domain-containing protein [Bizionia arctica]|uniref:D-Ala-D-Ala carboxypeptidase n=1 Tax=Bizionia arctica TaxID=1495645 RepID=A0A917GG74_9FLAO|nr:serine hydrolase domain-containing protein [Bizionia arctica]GGG44777.1 D-Ala-D-Ala carboxypeptidase [Bizionia arctica]
MKKLLIIILVVWNFSNLTAQNFNQLDEFLETLYKNHKMMGNLTISKDGNTIYNKSVGYQVINGKESIPITDASKFRIGSITKTFTAVMIFQLIDEGKLKLEQPLSKYFPQIPGSESITIASMLNHSSGLFNIAQDENFNEEIETTREQMLSKISSHQLNFEVGEKHEYSNTNYVLLGYILEDVEKAPYSQILETRIVKTLNLKNTFFGSAINTTNNECLSYYYDDNDGSLHEANQAILTIPGGAGGIVSNPSDLVIFLNGLFQGKLMSEKSFNVMTTINDEFGSGILSAKKNGMTIYAHNGTIDFFRSMYIYILDLDIAIALNTNALDYGLMPIMFNAIAAIKGEDLNMPSFKSAVLSESELNQYIGVYESDELPFNLVFESDGKVLKGAPEGSDMKVLKAINPDEFALESLGVTLIFNLEAKTLLFNQAGEAPKTLTKIK